MEPSREPSDAVWVDGATVTLGSNVILGPVSLRVRSGQSWAILGPNGSGKSTLLDLAGGVRHPTSGVVAILGGRLGSVDVRASGSSGTMSPRPSLHRFRCATSC
jgi:iron complex transport system ATP-binding protein